MNEDNKKIFFSREELKQRLQQLEAEIRAKEEFRDIPVTNMRRKYWIISINVALVAIFMICYLVRNLHDKNLFTRYYEPYPNVADFIERGESPSGVQTEALQLYEQGHYQEALERFERYFQSLPTESDILFYAGISCIETNQLEKAEIYLQQAARQPSNVFAAQAQWYLALIHLKKNNRRQARQQLQVLTRYTDIYKHKANQLLKEL